MQLSIYVASGSAARLGEFNCKNMEQYGFIQEDTVLMLKRLKM